jgi:hypothetical protein
MPTAYPVDVSIKLRPIYHEEPPEIRVGVNGHLSPCTLSETKDYRFQFYSDKPSTLQVEFLNKNPADTVPDLNLDKVVVIESVSFFGITDSRFAWAGIYHPVERDPMPSHTYLSWNGTWTLNFEVPVFTWMHRTQALGWIYQ